MTWDDVKACFKAPGRLTEAVVASKVNRVHRSLMELRRNIQPGDVCVHEGAVCTVDDVGQTIFSGKQILLRLPDGTGRWVPVVEVSQA